MLTKDRVLQVASLFQDLNIFVHLLQPVGIFCKFADLSDMLGDKNSFEMSINDDSIEIYLR